MTERASFPGTSAMMSRPNSNVSIRTPFVPKVTQKPSIPSDSIKGVYLNRIANAKKMRAKILV